MIDMTVHPSQSRPKAPPKARRDLEGSHPGGVDARGYYWCSPADIRQPCAFPSALPHGPTLPSSGISMVDWEGEGKVMPDFERLENRQRQGAQQEGDLPHWAARQQKVFTNWINNKIGDQALEVQDLFVDLQDGTVLYALLEALSKQNLSMLGRVKPETNKIKKIANMNTVWNYLSSTVKLVGIGPTDIVDGNVNLTLGMIWSLIVFFMAQDLGDAGQGLSVLKERIMEWMLKRTRHYPDVCVTDFTNSLADGRALLAILNDYDPAASPYEPGDVPADNLRRAFDDFRRLYGVGSILDPDDPLCCDDEKANITYLAEVMKAMPGSDVEDNEEEHRRRTDRSPAGLTTADIQQDAMRRADELLPATLEKLRELCAYGPNEGTACAAKVAEMMASAGLKDVKVLKPSDSREDPSGRGDPFVVGEKDGPLMSPTVLFYSSYGTVDEVSAALKNVAAPAPPSPHSPGDSQWSSDPLRLSDAHVSPTGAGRDGARVSARGVSHDKANVVSQLAAVKALLQGSPPCGIKVIVGATPPPVSLAGDASLDVADRLADLLRAHPAITGLPDLVVVSEPGGARLAPDKNAVVVGCRGFAALDVSVSTFDDDDEDAGRACSEYGGPLIDPARVLANIIASLHDPVTGALKVSGLCPPSAAAGAGSPGLSEGVTYGEAQLRYETGYNSRVACPKETYSVVGEERPTPASILEHLTVLPAVTVTSLTTRNNAAGTGHAAAAGDAGGGGVYARTGRLLGCTFPSSATAGVHICLPPGAEYAPALSAFQKHCEEHVPHGAQVRFENALGRTGWRAPPGSSLVSGVLASLRTGSSAIEGGDGFGATNPEEKRGWVAQGERETVMASQPGFSAIPSAFARALPASAVVGIGVNDPLSKGGLANESLLVEDLNIFIKGAVRIAHGLASTAAVAAAADEHRGMPVRAGVAPAGGAHTAVSRAAVGGGTGAGLLSGDTTVYGSSVDRRARSASSSPRRKEQHPQRAAGAPALQRFADDVDRRRAVNQLRGRRSHTASPSGSSCPSPAARNTGGSGTNNRGFSHSPVAGSPKRSTGASLFSSLERGDTSGASGGGGGGGYTVPAKHPLSPTRPASSASSTASLSAGAPAAAGTAANSPVAELLQSAPLGPRVPSLPTPPSAAMAAFAAAALGPPGVGGGEGGGGIAVMGAGPGLSGAVAQGYGNVLNPPPSARGPLTGGAAVGGEGEDEDDKVGGGTPENILAEINEVRENPAAYASKLEDLLQYYDKSMYNSPTGPPVQTTEGTKPLLEAIAMLEATPPLEPLEAKEGMQQAAADHVKDLATTGRTGHSGSDGSGAAERMNRYGQFFQVAGEVCTYFDATASGIVAQLLVSDGERSRHNRKALLATHFKVCGVALGTHPTVGAACVITLAGGYGPRPLAVAADVVCSAGDTPTAEFREVLESVPVPQITEEVRKCLKAGMKVQLQYSPGQVKCTFVQASGARKSMGCKWV